MDKNKTVIKNYELKFGNLGIQLKFNKDLKESDINNIMYYFNEYIKQLDCDYTICTNLFNIAEKQKEI